MARDSILGTLTVAVVLCVVCSVVVSSAAVLLHDRQQANKEFYQKTNILKAAGLVEPGASRSEVNEIFEKRVRQLLVHLDDARVVPESEHSYDEYDPREAINNPELSKEITVDGPTTGIDRREQMAFVYEVVKEGSDDQVEQYVIPIYGRGLWSTLYGFLAVDADGETIRGITFYEDGETPGLGGEVNNAQWQESWEGKQAYDDEGNVVIEVVKGSSSDPETEVDGLSGATITTKGVSDFVRYWLGPDGFGPYLKKQTAS